MMARIAEHTKGTFDGEDPETKASHGALSSMEWTGQYPDA